MVQLPENCCNLSVEIELGEKLAEAIRGSEKHAQGAPGDLYQALQVVVGVTIIVNKNGCTKCDLGLYVAIVKIL